MQAKTERFEMRLDQGAIERIDAWRADQNDLPSRAEAMRRLVDAGLAKPARRQPVFSDGEKMILLMLCDLYKHLKVTSEIDPTFVEAAVHGGHYWGLKWEYPGIFHDHEDNEGVVSEVVDILDMWSFLEGGYAKLSKKDKDRVRAEAEPFGKDVTFLGFDGNNESEHMGIARFLIDSLDRFSRFKGCDLNSHMPSIQTYRRMLSVFDPLRRTLTGGELNATQIIDILKAQLHPERR